MHLIRWIALPSLLGCWLLASQPALPMSAQNGAYHVAVEFENNTDKAAQVMVAYVMFKGQSSWEPAASANDTFKCMLPRMSERRVITFQTTEAPARMKYRVKVFSNEKSCEGTTLVTLETQDNLEMNVVPLYGHSIEGKRTKSTFYIRKT